MTSTDENLPTIGRNNLPEIGDKKSWDESVPLEVSPERLDEIQRANMARVGAGAMVKVVYEKIEAMETIDELYFLRLGVEDLRAQLKKALDEIDRRITDRAIAEGKTRFESGHDEQRAVIVVGQKREKKVTKDGAAKLQKLLLDPDPVKRECVLTALPQSPSAWKAAKVIEVCDTLGLDATQFVRIEWKDEVGVSYIPKYILERK